MMQLDVVSKSFDTKIFVVDSDGHMSLPEGSQILSLTLIKYTSI